MKLKKLSALLLTLCLLLCACVQPGDPGDHNTPPISGDQQTDAPDGGSSTPDDGKTGDDGATQAVYPAELMVELVVDWGIADMLLSHLDELADQLQEAVEDAGCPLDSVTLTISTAGGFTAQALLEGGIDAAILPAVDVIPLEKRASIIALSGEEIAGTAIAVSAANDDLSEEFCSILFKALTETQAGQDFLSACCGDAVFSAPTEDALQAVRDYLRELEEAGGGHA